MHSVPWKLSYDTLCDVLESAKHTYPNEFISLLSVSDKNPFLISEFVVVPSSFGRDHSVLRSDLIPFDPFIVGSVHSHPSSSMVPSRADKVSFSRLGKIHLILGFPYSVGDFRSYDEKGFPVRLEVVYPRND